MVEAGVNELQWIGEPLSVVKNLHLSLEFIVVDINDD